MYDSPGGEFFAVLRNTRAAGASLDPHLPLLRAGHLLYRGGRVRGSR
jgi:hypothetical protein